MARRPAYRLHRRSLGDVGERRRRRRAGDGTAEGRRHLGRARPVSPQRGNVAVRPRPARSADCANAHRRAAADSIGAAAHVGFRAARRRARDHAAPDVRHRPLSRARRAGRTARSTPFTSTTGRRGRSAFASCGATITNPFSTPCSAAPARRCCCPNRSCSTRAVCSTRAARSADGSTAAPFRSSRCFGTRMASSCPTTDLPALLETVYALPHRPALELPPDIHVTEVRAPPHPGISIHPDPTPWRKTHHRLVPFFLYGDLRVTDDAYDTPLFDRATLTVRHRDAELERLSRSRVSSLGAREEVDPRRARGVAHDSRRSARAARPRSRRRGLARRSRRRGLSARRPTARDDSVGHRLVRARRRRPLRRHRGVAAGAARRATKRRVDDRPVGRQSRASFR